MGKMDNTKGNSRREEKNEGKKQISVRAIQIKRGLS